VSTKSDLWEKMKESKDFRDAYVASRIKKDISLQIRTLRNKRGWSQKDLAEITEMAQARISLMENPNYGKFNTETLKRLAKAFDVALIVRFAPFSELINWSETLSPESFEFLSFQEEVTFLEQDQITTRATPDISESLVTPNISAPLEDFEFLGSVKEFKPVRAAKKQLSKITSIELGKARTLWLTNQNRLNVMYQPNPMSLVVSETTNS